jgi:N-acetylmuramoyl-L-alanine amidase
MFATVLLAMAVVGCSTPFHQDEQRKGYVVNHAFKAIGQNERVRFIIMHYTALDEQKSVETLTQEQVSAHYLVQKNPASEYGTPAVLQLVDENKRAWHAGVSNWNGRSNLNDTSIGIEIVNLGYTENMLGSRTWYDYNQKQVVAIAALVKDISQRYQITPDNILGHSDIAPLRKQDPGKLFPWERLASMGIGAWPDRVLVAKYLNRRSPDVLSDVKNLQVLLKHYGYDQIPQTGVLDKETRETIAAFQMHFRPRDIRGNADVETEAIARALVEKYRSPE